MKNDMSSRSATAALVLAGALAAGCARDEQVPNAWTQVVQDEVCTYYNNIWWPDPRDPNGTASVWSNVLRPVVADCSTSISAWGSASGVIQYERSPSLTAPTTWPVRANSLSQSEKQIRDFTAKVNPATVIGENVRPFKVSTQTPTIQITWGTILASASPEGEKSEGDRSLFVPSPRGNTTVASQRADDVYAQILRTLAKAGVGVTGQGRISKKTQVLPLTIAEFGSLAQAELVPNGNMVNPAMEHIAKVNAGGAKSDAYKSAIEAKRFAKIDLDYKATWVQRVIDVSTAGWIAVWAAALTIIGWLGFWVRQYKNSRK